MIKVGDKMKKLTIEQKTKVKKFIKHLAEVKYYRFSQDKESMDLLYRFQKNVNSECDSIKRENDVNMKTWENIKQMVTLIINDIQEFDSDRKMESKKNKNTLKESNTYTMLSALRDIVDDFQLKTELLIDEKYGKADHDQFRKLWGAIASEFERKFNSIQKNLISAAKQKGV